MSRAPTYRDVEPVRELVTEEEAGECLYELDRTIHDFAEFQYRKRVADLAAKRVYASLYSTARASSHQGRVLEVENSQGYLLAAEQAARAERDLTKLKHAQELWRLKVDLWRTISANKRERDKLESQGGGSGYGQRQHYNRNYYEGADDAS